MPQTLTPEQREKARARNRQWYQRNLESQRLRSRIKTSKTFAENPEKLREANRRSYAANIETRRAKNNLYNLNNRQARRKAAKLNYHKRKNDPRVKAAKTKRSKNNYLENREHVQKKHREWMLQHPGIQRVYAQKRRALEKSAVVNLRQIKEWMLSIKAKPFASCYYCAATVSTKRIHFEHIVPLSRGGSHSIENLCVSCKLCNLHKGTRHISEWDKQGQQVMNL